VHSSHIDTADRDGTTLEFLHPDSGAVSDMNSTKTMHSLISPEISSPILP
jgi:hypothetical protein